jgi:prepilin-type N-terminal cleavage/methylation domain-containing protein
MLNQWCLRFFKSKATTKPRAFSLIELSIVILILGVITAAVVTSGVIISKIRMANAHALTMASPINTIEGVSLWLESSLETSFSDAESSDGSSISSWHNNLLQNENDATQSDLANQPTYANTINRIHAVRFDGSNKYLTVDGKFLNDKDYTFFFVEKRQSDKVNNFFISNSSTDTNRSLRLGYGSSGKITHAQGSANSYNGSVGAFGAEGEQPKIVTFIQDSGVGKAVYVNGILASQSDNTNKLSNIDSLKIGEGYNGELGEIIAFDRALDNQERTEVEEYLAKKWLLASNGEDLSCTNGTISGSQCIAGSCSVDLIGTTTYLVSEGNGSLNCDASGYTGSSSYSCSNGDFNAASTCSCASGYTKVDGVCQSNCSIGNEEILGVTATSADAGSGNLSCDAFGYAGTISYTCSNRTLNTTGSCSCASGYSMSGGTCKSDCAVSGITGIDNTSVHHGTGNLTCNQPGSSGTVSYTCTNGSLNTSGSCSSTTCSITSVTGFNDKTGLAYTASAATISSPCATGYTASSPAPTYTCTSNGPATIASGSCDQVTCTIAAANGFAAKTGLIYTASPLTISSPCASGYVASSPAPTYTCTASGAATVSGTCDQVTCTIAAANGFVAKTGLNYAASPTAIPTPCQSGYTGSPTYTCTASGAATVSGTCDQVTCTIAAANGFAAKTELIYTASPLTISSPCASGYVASSPAPTYTCTTAGAATVSGTCSCASGYVSHNNQCILAGRWNLAFNSTSGQFTGYLHSSGALSNTCSTALVGKSILITNPYSGNTISLNSSQSVVSVTNLASIKGIFNCYSFYYSSNGSYSDPSCVSTTPTSSSQTHNLYTCDYPCEFNNVPGITNGTTVSYTTSSRTQNCNAPNYNGSVTYTCGVSALGTLSITGSCNPPCLANGIPGIVNGTTVASGNGWLSCNAAGYHSLDSVYYSCSGGTIKLQNDPISGFPTACDSCSSGYSWNGSACVANTGSGCRWTQISAPNQMFRGHASSGCSITTGYICNSTSQGNFIRTSSSPSAPNTINGTMFKCYCAGNSTCTASCPPTSCNSSSSADSRRMYRCDC